MSRKSALAVFDAAEKAGLGRDGHVHRSKAEVHALLFPGRGEHESVVVQPEWTGCTKSSKVGVTLKQLADKYAMDCIAGEARCDRLHRGILQQSEVALGAR